MLDDHIYTNDQIYHLVVVTDNSMLDDHIYTNDTELQRS